METVAYSGNVADELRLLERTKRRLQSIIKIRSGQEDQGLSANQLVDEYKKRVEGIVVYPYMNGVDNGTLLRKNKEELKKVEKRLEELKIIMDLEANRERTKRNFQMAERDRIRDVLDRRGIHNLYHFTRIENLNSILTHGLLPVSLHNGHRISSIRNDYERFDSLFNFTSFSVGFPNYKLFYYFSNKIYPETKWVVLELNANMLTTPNRTICYCKTNAAYLIPRQKDLNKLTFSSAFEEMFAERIVTTDNREVLRRELKIREDQTTDPQAEVLIKGKIDPVFITGICFENERDLNSFKDMNFHLLKNRKYRVDKELFKYRKDFSHWSRERSRPHGT